jgi:flagellar basal-body rod protein FlgC
MEADVLSIAGSALTAERLRMDVVAGNIANASTTRDHEGNIKPYRRSMVSFQTILDDKNLINGVTVNDISEDSSPFKAIYDPQHPDANPDGYVYYPNVQVERELIDLVTAKSAYQANVTSIQTYKAMFNAALEI